MPTIITFVQRKKEVLVSKARKRNERIDKVETKLSLFIACLMFYSIDSTFFWSSIAQFAFNAQDLSFLLLLVISSRACLSSSQHLLNPLWAG